MAKEYSINILGLSKGIHTFEFQLNEKFFEQLGQETVEKGKLSALITLDKRETFIEADFKIKGTVQLICDRSLDEFDYPIARSKKIVFKYGEVPQEVSDEIFIITDSQAQLDVGQLIYEFISLEIPMKKLHPRFENDDDENHLIYSSQVENEETKMIDPRWEILKKLK